MNECKERMGRGMQKTGMDGRNQEANLADRMTRTRRDDERMERD